MKSLKGSSLIVILFLIAGVSVFPVYAGTTPSETDPPPKKEECIKCHSGPVNDIKTAGGKHRAVPCGGCHIGHPPTVKKPIEKCSRCHLTTRKAHFELEDCLRCHKNPHTPLNMSLADKGVCLTCHTQQDAQLRDNKSRHSTIDCTTCHPVHRQVPQCSQCHKGKAHFDLKDCLNCHMNPHMPLNMSLAGRVTNACVTCHAQQVTQLSDNKSKHSIFDCTACHNVHRQIPQCTQCHQPHSAEMVAADCKKCHKAHLPKQVTYVSDTPSRDCGACHRKALDLLNASEAKHKPLTCASCHQERHKMIPDCKECHGSPHAAGIMAKFPKCGNCHNIAHDVNNWPETQPKEEPKTKQ